MANSKHVASAPARPPRLPVTLVALVTKKLIDGPDGLEVCSRAAATSNQQSREDQVASHVFRLSAWTQGESGTNKRVRNAKVTVSRRMVEFILWTGHRKSYTSRKP